MISAAACYQQRPLEGQHRSAIVLYSPRKHSTPHAWSDDDSNFQGFSFIYIFIHRTISAMEQEPRTLTLLRHACCLPLGLSESQQESRGHQGRQKTTGLSAVHHCALLYTHGGQHSGCHPVERAGLEHRIRRAKPPLRAPYALLHHVGVWALCSLNLVASSARQRLAAI